MKLECRRPMLISPKSTHPARSWRFWSRKRARLCAEGVTSLRGRIPVCPSGGLQARGHPAHVTPLYSFHEIFEQLTGRADDRAVAGAELAVCTAQARQLQRGHGSCAGGRLVTLPIVRIERRRAYPPRATEFTGRFWANLAEGRLETTVCDACDRMTFPPKPFCPHCWSSSISWTELSGRGRLYSQTIVHAAPAVFEADVPYCLGIVDLDDGIRVAMRLISDIPLALDGPVQIVVLSYTDGPLFAACGGCESPSAESTWRPSERHR